MKPCYFSRPTISWAPSPFLDVKPASAQNQSKHTVTKLMSDQQLITLLPPRTAPVVHSRASRCVHSDWWRHSTPTAMIQQLKWKSLQHRRHTASLTVAYISQHGSWLPSQFIHPASTHPLCHRTLSCWVHRAPPTTNDSMLLYTNLWGLFLYSHNRNSEQTSACCCESA